MWVHDLETAEFHYPIWVTRVRQSAYIISKTHRLNYDLRIWGSYQLFPLEKVASFLQKKCQRLKGKTKKIHLILCLLKENNPYPKIPKKTPYLSYILSLNKTIKKHPRHFRTPPFWPTPFDLSHEPRWIGGAILCSKLSTSILVGRVGTQLLLFLLFGKDFVVR